jgi:hypothetical protein
MPKIAFHPRGRARVLPMRVNRKDEQSARRTGKFPGKMRGV